jgi:putative FmdB family regulatory protein
MPLYEYHCDTCGHRFEAIQKFSDAPLDTCPKCGAALRKLQSAPAIQFKGAGWYITDYAKKESVSPGKSGDSSHEGDSASNTTKSSTESAASAPKDAAAAAPAAPAASPTGTKSST